MILLGLRAWWMWGRLCLAGGSSRRGSPPLHLPPVCYFYSTSILKALIESWGFSSGRYATPWPAILHRRGAGGSGPGGGRIFSPGVSSPPPVGSVISSRCLERISQNFLRMRFRPLHLLRFGAMNLGDPLWAKIITHETIN